VPNFFSAVRSSAGSPLRLTRAISEALGTVNGELAVSVRSLSDQVDDSLAQDRVVAALATFFGLVALLLAVLGLYGVTAYAVAQRRSEIGVRMALGAAPGGVIRLVMSSVAVLVGTGLAIGAVASAWASKFIGSLLYGVEPHDAVTLIAAAVLLGTVGAFAGWLPAWRASQIDPAEVLRDA
jgi:putative ABC transport system permease protein